MTYLPHVDPHLEIAAGRVPGTSRLHKYGNNAAVGTTYTVIGSSLGATYPFPTTAETLDIVSDNAADTSAGAGMRTIRLQGLDASWAAQSEDVTLNGTTAVTTSNTFRRIYRAYGLTTGTYGVGNTGILTITNTTSGQNLLYIPASVGQSLIAVYTVPAGSVGYMTKLGVTSDSTKTLDFQLIARPDADDVAAPFGCARVQDSITGIVHPYSEEYRSYRIFTGPCDVWVQAKVSSGTSDVSAYFDMFLETS